jgi:hypothetical protein
VSSIYIIGAIRNRTLFMGEGWHRREEGWVNKILRVNEKQNNSRVG